MARVLTTDRLCADELPWHRLRYQHTQALRAALDDRYSPATAKRHLAVTRIGGRVGVFSSGNYAVSSTSGNTSVTPGTNRTTRCV